MSAGYARLANTLEALGRLLREARRARGLSLRDAAPLTGLSHGTLSRVERGQVADCDTAVKILRWLDGGEEANPT